MKEMDKIGEKMEEKSEDGTEGVTNLKREPRGRNNFFELYIELSFILSVRTLTIEKNDKLTVLLFGNSITKFSPFKRATND
jgi:hypothetical protein